MILEIQEVARVVEARATALPAKVTGWSVDTRTQSPGDLYFALQGPNHDGHDYAAAAIQNGAAGVVVERDCGVPNQLLVADTLAALQTLGRYARNQWGGRVIGVTGSAGKTTTKDAIAALLSVGLPTGRTI